MYLCSFVALYVWMFVEGANKAEGANTAAKRNAHEHKI